MSQVGKHTHIQTQEDLVGKVQFSLKYVNANLKWPDPVMADLHGALKSSFNPRLFEGFLGKIQALNFIFSGI